MPATTFEQIHYHKDSQQFFFILKGEAFLKLKMTLFNINREMAFTSRQAINIG